MDGYIYDGHGEACEIWRERAMRGIGARRVLIAHAEVNVGDALALLLAMRGMEAVQAGDRSKALQLALDWHPQVVFVDTRMGNVADMHDHALARSLREQSGDPALPDSHFLIAFAAAEVDDPRDTLRDAGYDGFVRTPCPVWRIYDLLTRFYAQ